MRITLKQYFTFMQFKITFTIINNDIIYSIFNPERREGERRKGKERRKQKRLRGGYWWNRLIIISPCILFFIRVKLIILWYGKGETEFHLRPSEPVL